MVSNGPRRRILGGHVGIGVAHLPHLRGSLIGAVTVRGASKGQTRLGRKNDVDARPTSRFLERLGN